MPEARAKTVIGKKNPIIAVIASFFIPGLGHFYSGEESKGTGYLIIAIAFVSLWLFLIQEKQPDMAGPILVAGGACVLLWIGSMYDAYNTAKEINSRIQ